jgi:zinc transporter ZupT
LPFGWPPALLASVIASLVAAIGILTVSFRPNLAIRHRATFAALAAGVLLSTSLFILPEAFAGAEAAPLAALIGYFAFFTFSRFARRPEGRAWAAFVAIAAHSTIDGMEYGLLFSADTMAGVLGSVGLIIHEFSEGIVLLLILRAAKVPLAAAIFLALLGAAATTPIGTLATLTVLPNLSQEGLSLGLGFAAGALLFVGASQLPEEFGELSFRPAILAYALGASLGMVLMWTHQHGHDGEHHHDHDHRTEASDDGHRH